MLHTTLLLTEKLPFPLTGPKTKENVSLIWSSCNQTVSASHSLLVTANCSSPVPDTPFGFLFKKRMKKHQFEERFPSIGSAAGSITAAEIVQRERMEEIFGLICYCMEHTTLTL